MALGSGLAVQVAHDLGVRTRRMVGPRVAQRIPCRVAGTVEVFVVVAHRVRDQVALRHRAFHDDVGTRGRMRLHDFPSVRFQALG
ncbi:hypothetical protein G6F65_023024 [Rhizopus arrhizus]|nr:hypothetical protein G6F65_023024 [Rhizopus arrhizus]